MNSVIPGEKAHPLIRALCAAVWICLIVYAVLVARDFYRFVDRDVYVSLDDSLANEAYTLASEGRYGFLASPVLFGIPRHHGEFSYGPWYFYLGAGLIWFFGYSLTLVRSIHLWTIISTVVAASFWFRGRAGALASAVFGFSILYCFNATMWPMARPDVLVSGFAIALVICVGLAFTDDRPLYWFGAGLAASCGAFNHLIAWSLLPSCALLFGVAALARLRSNAVRRDVWSALSARAAALFTGVLLGATMFYGSFGFRFADQARMFAAYREQIASPETHTAVVLHHFAWAFGYLPGWEQALVWATLVAGWALVAAAVWRWPAARATVNTYLLPPLVVWSGYFVSLGWYANFHKGYAILNEVMAFWTAAAIVWSALRILDMIDARLATRVLATLTAIALVIGVRQVQWQLQASAVKMGANDWVSISDYIERLLDQVPARATAWGSVMYGIETPERIQLLQFGEGHYLLNRVPAAQRRLLAPDFMILGYPEQRDNTRLVMRGGDAMLNSVVEMFAGMTYHLDSMVAAAPYGVTRLYSRRNADSSPVDVLPEVSVYDAQLRQWLTRIDRPITVAFTAIAPAEFKIGYENDPVSANATRSVSADLPAGKYLLRVSVTPGAGRTKRRLVAVGSPKLLRQTISERGPEGDYSSYFSSDTTVMLVSIHDGGPFYVSQFDSGAGADIRAVDVFPIGGLTAVSNIPNLPPVNTWEPAPGVRASAASDGSLTVAGDASAQGYQVVSPAIKAEPHDRVKLVINVTVEQGKLCWGVLNGNQLNWIVPPDRLRTDVAFRMDDTSSFVVVTANCNASDAQAVPTRFTLRGGSYVAERTALYTDRFMASIAPRVTSPKASDVLPGVLAAPPDLLVTRGILTRPVNPLQPIDLFFQAPIVRGEEQGWTIAGRAEGPYAYLLRMKDRYLERNSRIFGQGRLEKGGLAIGLLRNDQWAAQVTVTKPGDFTFVVAPPASGTYSILVSNNTQAPDTETSAALTKFGVIVNGAR